MKVLLTCLIAVLATAVVWGLLAGLCIYLGWNTAGVSVLFASPSLSLGACWAIGALAMLPGYIVGWPSLVARTEQLFAEFEEGVMGRGASKPQTTPAQPRRDVVDDQRDPTVKEPKRTVKRPLRPKPKQRPLLGGFQLGGDDR